MNKRERSISISPISSQTKENSSRSTSVLGCGLSAENGFLRMGGRDSRTIQFDDPLVEQATGMSRVRTGRRGWLLSDHMMSLAPFHQRGG
jgi:hypothetical protein